MLPPFNFYKWIDENKDKLQPPVGNFMFYHGEFKVMVVGGPNHRKDYHINNGEEWFFQIKGDISVNIVEKEEFKEIEIKEGEMFLLPGNIPHSPQRPKDTIGIVIERERRKDEIDGLRWYCEKCKTIVFEEFFHCFDLGVQLIPVIKKWGSDKDLRTCKKCGHLNKE
jgi:3-hydroxyanthranilate 3,4-dioxygenase